MCIHATTLNYREFSAAKFTHQWSTVRSSEVTRVLSRANVVTGEIAASACVSKVPTARPL